MWIKKGSIVEDDYTRGAMFAKHATTAVRPVVNSALEVEKVEEADPAEEGFIKEEMIDGDERNIIEMPERADCSWAWHAYQNQKSKKKSKYSSVSNLEDQHWW